MGVWEVVGREKKEIKSLWQRVEGEQHATDRAYWK